MRRKLTLALAAAGTASVGVLVPATASAACDPAQVPACTGGTTVTALVGISGVGVVSIAPPAALALTQSGNTLSNAVPALTTVTDTRAPAVGSHNSWAVTAKMTDLTMVGVTGTAPSIAASGNASMFTDTPVVTLPGTASVTDNHASSGTALSLTNTDATLLSASTSNVNTVTFNSTVNVSVPNGATAGVYTGTLTETVS
jgi:hypothetical protein